MAISYGGVKAATDYSFVGQTWNELEFSEFRRVLKLNGLEMTSPIVQNSDNPKLIRRVGLVYDPRIIESTTSNSIYAPKFHRSQDLSEYITSAEKQGYKMSGVYGKLYSFPDSAIDDFLNQVDGQERETAAGGNEVYWYYLPAKPDNVSRKNYKVKFFDELSKNLSHKKIRDGNDLKKSNEEWNDRLRKSGFKL